jgi:hypothetical protein
MKLLVFKMEKKTWRPFSRSTTSGGRMNAQASTENGRLRTGWRDNNPTSRDSRPTVLQILLLPHLPQKGDAL